VTEGFTLADMDRLKAKLEASDAVVKPETINGNQYYFLPVHPSHLATPESRRDLAVVCAEILLTQTDPVVAESLTGIMRACGYQLNEATT
jgi:hypothetical protein